MSRLRATTLLVLTLGSAVLVGCAGGDEAAFAPVAGSDGAYCKTYRAWKVYELDAGGAFDQPSPAALRTWWNEYLVAEETMLRESPPELRDAVGIKVGQIRAVLTPLLETYEFDLARVRREGTAAEQAAFFGPPPVEVEKAQEAQYAYEEKTCGTAPTPPPAHVVFEADASSTPYCVALVALNAELERVSGSQFDPEVMRALVTGDRFSEILNGLDDAAPAVIVEDVEADTEWFRNRWSDAVEAYDYDLRRIYLDATPEDLAIFNRTHPDVLEHTSRTTAYESQICSN